MVKPIVIVGKGSIGQRHSDTLTVNFPDIPVVHLGAGIRSGATPADIVAEVISYDPRCVLVASPAHLHAAHTLPLLAKGIPCLVEKPMALTAADADAMLQASINNHVALQIGYNLRCRSEYQEIVSLLPLLGNIQWASFHCGQNLKQWRPNRELDQTASGVREWGGGVIWELSHEIDLAVSMIPGLKLEHAIVTRGIFPLSVDEVAMLTLSNAHQKPVHIHLDLHAFTPNRTIRVCGTKGQISADFIARTVTVDFGQGPITKEFPPENTYFSQLSSFLAHIEAGSFVSEDTQQALEVVNLVEKVYQYTSQ